MYLIDTNVISETRKGEKTDSGVQKFFNDVISSNVATYLSVITVGELRQGIENIRHRNDDKQADMLEIWLNELLTKYDNNILAFDSEAAQVWGYSKVPQHQHAIDR